MTYCQRIINNDFPHLIYVQTSFFEMKGILKLKNNLLFLANLKTIIKPKTTNFINPNRFYEFS